jgi:hypothetical protein
MKELISEQQADLIVLLLSLLIVLGSLAYGAWAQASTPKPQRRLLWVNCLLGALAGPVIWCFWTFLYNPIEDHYGLDSLKALGINFAIALGLGVLFSFLFTFAPRWILGRSTPTGRK